MEKLLAVFVKHVTLQTCDITKSTSMSTRCIINKNMAMRNCGEYEWGYNVELVYCKLKVMEISANIKIPRNQKDIVLILDYKKFYGPRVWVDIIVKALDEMDKNISNNCGKQNDKN